MTSARPREDFLKTWNPKKVREEAPSFPLKVFQYKTVMIETLEKEQLDEQQYDPHASLRQLKMSSIKTNFFQCTCNLINKVLNAAGVAEAKLYICVLLYML
ncbi:hypothetical protein CEXT_741731 [Caerostris extrusa]|uniref:Uncharacterized protein n=1 Tax=Caerostris extrusa TaxID=172846 RepID=A0AAV4W8J4_CAEEX|nr:hypothetical protein CEXT_741731 [Caerostris extrusa]